MDEMVALWGGSLSSSFRADDTMASRPTAPCFARGRPRLRRGLADVLLPWAVFFDFMAYCLAQIQREPEDGTIVANHWLPASHSDKFPYQGIKFWGALQCASFPGWSGSRVYFAFRPWPLQCFPHRR